MPNLKKVLLLLGLLSVFYLVLLLALFFTRFRNPSDHLSDWANFGNFLGGAAGPVFSLISLLAILYTIGLQTKEISRASFEQSRANSHSEMNAITALITHYKEQESLAAKCAENFAGQPLGQQAYNEQVDYRDRRRTLEAKLESHYSHLVGQQFVQGASGAA